MNIWYLYGICWISLISIRSGNCEYPRICSQMHLAFNSCNSVIRFGASRHGSDWIRSESPRQIGQNQCCEEWTEQGRPETVRDRRLRRLRRLIVVCLWKFSQSWPIVDFAFCVVLQLFCKLHLQQWKCQPGFSEPYVSIVTVLEHEGQTESLYWLKNHKSQKMCKAKRWLILLKVFLLRSMEWRVWPRFSPWRHGLNGCFVWHLNTPNLERDRQGGIR